MKASILQKSHINLGIKHKTAKDFANCIKRLVGSDYSRINWPSEKKTKEMKRDKELLISSLSKKANFAFNKNKIYINKLSPGCLTCGQGTWSCLFFNGV